MLAAVVTVTVFAAVAVTYALLVPPLQNADEMYHLHYAQLIANHAQLPGALFTEKQQPPLYYLIGALIIKAGGSLTALRLMSVALGVTTVALVMAVARELVPGRPAIAVGAGIVTASFPITVAVSASFSDDVLAWAAGAALLWCIARVLRSRSPSRKLLLVCGIAAGIGLLSKETDWLLVLALAVAIAIGGWWFVRNVLTFHAVVPPLQPLTTTHPYLRSFGELKVFASGAVRSLFGPERADGGPLVRSFPIQVLIGVLFAMVVFVLAVAAWQASRRWSGWNRTSRLVAVIAAAVCAFLVAEWTLNSVLFDLQPQSRYLFVAVALPATAMVWAGSIIARWLACRARFVVGTAVIVVTTLIGIDSLRVAVLRTP
jgi:hypothetical protein